jgi:hypothetical protein
MKYFYVCYINNLQTYNTLLKTNANSDPFGYCLTNHLMRINFWEISKETYNLLKKKNGEKS